MKRIVRLTESDLTRIVRRVISEQQATKDNPLGNAMNRIDVGEDLNQLSKFGITRAPLGWDTGGGTGSITSYANWTREDGNMVQQKPFYYDCASGRFTDSGDQEITDTRLTSSKSLMAGFCSQAKAKYCKAKAEGIPVYDASPVNC